MRRAEDMRTAVGGASGRFGAGGKPRPPAWPLWVPASLAAVILLAGSLRFYGMDAIFESSDQAAMACLVRHSFGWNWIFAHDYGPVLPLGQVAAARMFMLVHWPIDEFAARLVPALLSLAQVLMTWPLLHRLGCSPGECLAGTLACAILPALVSDAHYPWAVHTAWLLGGTLALWGTLAWFDDRRPWMLVLAAVGLACHGLSGSYAFALPAVLVLLWWREGRSLAAFLAGFVVPCLLALTVIVLSWGLTGGGQLGHLLRKADGAAFGLHVDQLTRLPGMWSSQTGPVFGAVAAAAVLALLPALFRGERLGLIALWVAVGLPPFIFLADWEATGYACYYLFDIVYVASLAGAVFLRRGLRAPGEGEHGAFRPASRAVAVRAVSATLAAASAVQLFSGSLDVLRADDSLQPWSGIQAHWGAIRPDSGIKAAAGYVRQYVPDECVVMCLHGRDGMEVPVAEYYIGRKVLAGYDHPPAILPGLVRTMQPAVDVIIAEPAHAALLESAGGMACVARFHRAGTPVRLIYARPQLCLPVVEGPVVELNARYDEFHRVYRVPAPLAAPAGFPDILRDYQRTVSRLKNKKNLSEVICSR